MRTLQSSSSSKTWVAFHFQNFVRPDDDLEPSDTFLSLFESSEDILQECFTFLKGTGAICSVSSRAVR